MTCDRERIQIKAQSITITDDGRAQYISMTTKQCHRQKLNTQTGNLMHTC